MIKRVCFYNQTPFTKRDYERLGIELLKTRGFEVTFLDLTRILHPQYLKGYQNMDFLKADNLSKPRNYNEVENYFKNNLQAFGIALFQCSPNNFTFFKILGKFGIKYASFLANCLPVAPDKLSQHKSLLSRLGDLELSGLKNRIDAIKYHYFAADLQSAEFCLLGGRKSADLLVVKLCRAESVFIHTLDYDLYLMHRNSAPDKVVEGNYAVFLDEYFPLHPDFLLQGALKNPYKNPNDYYNELKMIFSHIEEKTHIPVVVAAHPRSQYDKLPDFFGGRKIIKGQTVNLVANSQLVLAHSSTALNFAVLFLKPIIFLMPEKAKGGYYDYFISNFAKQFKKNTLDQASLGNKKSLDDDLSVDTQAYSDFREDYIKKTGSPEKYFWDVFADKVESSVN